MFYFRDLREHVKEVSIGLIGAGFMGRCHALAFRNVKAVFGDLPTPRLEMLCDMRTGRAAQMAVGWNETH